MTTMDKLSQIRIDVLDLQSKEPHLSRSLDGVIDYLDDAIDSQHGHDGTGKYAPTDEDLKYMEREIKMEGERE